MSVLTLSSIARNAGNTSEKPIESGVDLIGDMVGLGVVIQPMD